MNQSDILPFLQTFHKLHELGSVKNTDLRKVAAWLVLALPRVQFALKIHGLVFSENEVL